MAGQTQRIRSAVIDGRAHSLRYIQKQLAQLYDVLQKTRPAIHDAIIQDSGYSPAEADAEIFLAMKAAKQCYEDLSLEKSLDQEYSIAHGKDNPSRRTPVGCVYIISSRHSQFYSIVQPACAAMAAGNCVIVEINQTISQLGSLLRKILTDTMDKDTFLIVESQPDEDFLSKNTTVVDGRTTPSAASSFRVLSSPPSRTVTIVDRTSLIADAAQAVVRSRLAFCGRSPYAPDLILVNEFVLDEFCRSAARYAAVRFGLNPPTGNIKNSQMEITSDLQKELQKSRVRTFIAGSGQCIAIIEDRQSSLLNKTISEPVLLVHPIRSLDDAIDLINLSATPLRAAYVFAAPPAAKYLSQFISTRITFVNHIPVDLLVGPAAPAGWVTTVQARYTTEMFSTPCPEYITQYPQPSVLTRLLDEPNREVMAAIKVEMSASLSPLNEPTGKVIGFFEQGLLTGLGVAVVAAVVGSGYLIGYVSPVIIRRFR